jgi:phosphomannomutase / phosphoglucomutase
MQLEPTMFRKYDIRGRVSENELNEASVEAIGRAFGGMLLDRGVKTCVVGFDNRSYSEALTNAAVRGLVAAGIRVKQLGMVTVPVVYWAQYFLKVPGVCMGTASHNPNGWFGLKLGTNYSSTLEEEGIQELYKRLEQEEFVSGKGEVEPVSGVIEEYGKDLVSRAKLYRPLRVVVDAGNGTAGPINAPILDKFGVEVIGQYVDSDPTFPNHEPNPSLVDFQQDLAKKVLETGADLGIGFDADGDRLGVVDNLGKPMFPDKVSIFLARLALKAEPGASIVFDVKSSQALADDIRTHGGAPVMWKTGHSFIKAKSVEVDAALGCERSGHIFIRRGYFGYDDALFAALKFLEYVSSQDEKVSELHKQVSTYVTSSVISAECRDEKKEAVVQALVQGFVNEFGKEQVITVDGARVQFEDGWGLVRASSNLPELVLVFEARTAARMQEIKELFRTRLQQFSEVGPFLNDA